MGRTKRLNRQTARMDRKQVTTDLGEAKLTDLTEVKDPNMKKVTMVDQEECHEPEVEKDLAAGEVVMASKPSAGRQKRKLSQTQTPESDSHKSKRQRISSKTASQVSANKSRAKKTPQNTRQTNRYPVRCRINNGSKPLQSTVAFSAEFTDVAVSNAKTRKKSTKKSLAVDSDQVPSSVAGSDESMKKECKPEVGSVLNTIKEAKKLVGAHCSIAGGLHKAVDEAVAMGGRAFGLFLRSQRSWTSKPLDPVAAEKFKAACKEHGFPPNSILPHGSYLMNCGSPNPDTLKKSWESLLEELQRCEALGLALYNFHPGSTCGEITVEKCLDNIAEAINWAHRQTKFVITVVENMSCQGNTVGGRFEELKGIIDRVKDKSRIGICLDTCHAFAAGYDLSSKQGFEKFVSDFDSIVGLQYLKAMHLNDSKGDVGCHLDRHENIGKGKIGLEGFRRVMAEPRFNGIPMILETPLGDYAREITLLNSLL